MPAYYKDDTVADLNKLVSLAKGPRSRFEPVWQLNLAYYFGEQWLFWNRGRLDRPRLDPHRVTLTDNRIIGIVQTALAKMTKQKPAWQVVPVTAEDQDRQAAEMGEKVLDFLWRHLEMREELETVLLWSLITGSGFLKVVWDSAKGQKLQIVTDGEGQPTMHAQTGAPMRPQDFQGELPEGLAAKTIATGDVHIETVSPLELLVDPVAVSLKQAEWCIHETVKSPEYVKQHYGVSLEPDTDVAPGPTEARMFPTYQMGGSSGYRGVRLREYWCRPNGESPQGKRIVWAKDKIILQEANPYKCLPFVMFKGVPIPGRLYPTSVVEQLRGPQTELNKIRSQIVENAQRMGNPALLASRQANISYSGVPGERIDFDDTVPNAIPTYLQPPTMPQYVLQQQEKIEMSMQDISGQHEVSNAQVPTGVKAASAINLLQEADDTRLGPAIYRMEETLGVAGQMLLKIIAQNWNDERIIMISGEDYALDAMAFRGAALRENTKAEVQSGSMFPKSKAAKQAGIETLLNLIFQYQGQQPWNERMIAKAFRDLEAGAIEKVFGDVSVDERQINRENQEISQMTPVEVNPYDNQKAHIEGHEEFQKGATYRQLGPIVGQLMEKHVAEHRERLLAQMPPPAPPEGAEGPPPAQLEQEHAHEMQLQQLKGKQQVEAVRAKPAANGR